MKQTKELQSFPKIEEKARESNVDRQAYLFMELSRLLRRRIKENRVTTVDALGAMQLAMAKLAVDSLRPEEDVTKPEKEEEVPTYFG